jgi:hypothetical protein
MNNYAELVKDLYGKYAPDVDINEKFKYIVDNDLNVDDFVKEFYGKYAPEENLQEKQDYIFKNYFPDQYNVNTIKSKPKEIDPSDFENTQEKNTFLEDFFGKNSVTDFFGDFIRAGKSGYHGGTSVNESFDLFKKGKNMTNEEVVELVKRFREMEGAGQTDEMLGFSKRFSELKENYGGIGGTLLAWMDNPTVMAQYTTQSLVQMAASALDSEEVLGTAAASSGAGALVGAGTGAALTSIGGPLAVFGAAAGGIGGGIGGFMGGLSGAMETGLTTAQLVQETAEEQGLNWATMTDEERIGFIRKATNDEKSFNDIKSKALARGITIGAIDGIIGAVSAGAGKTIFSSVAKTSLSKVAGLAATGGVATLETAGGMASEYFGQKAAGQEYNLEEIMIEGFADKTFTGIQAIKSLNQGTPKYTLNGQTLNGKEFSDALKAMDDEAYSGADIKIENSPGVQKLVDNRNENISIDQDINSKISDVNDRSEAIKLEKQKRALENNKTESGKIKLAKIKNKISELENKYENSEVDVSVENRKKAVANALDTKFEKQFNKNLESVQDFADQKGLDIDINENEDTYFQKIADATNQTLEQVKEKAVGSDGAFIGKGKIFINKTQAKKIGAVNVASHEVLHPVLNALVGGTKAQQNLVNGFKNKLNSKQRSMMDKFMGTQPEGTEYLTVFTDNFDAIMAEQNTTQKISDFFRNMYVKLGYENINFDSGEGIYNFLKEYSKSTRDGKLSDRATQAIDKAEAKVDTKIGDVDRSSKVADFSKTSKEAKEVNDAYNSTANKTEAGFNIAMKYRGMAENTFKSIRDGGNYTQDQIDKLNENKDDIIAMMLYDKIPSQKQDSKARNVLGLVQDFVKEKQKYGNPAAYINTFFKSRSKEVVNYFVPDAVVESMNDKEGNIKSSVAKKSNTATNKDQGPAARALTDFNDLMINDENFITSDIYNSIKSKIINNVTLLLSKGNLDVNSMVEIINKEISNVIKKAQGKISKVDGKVVISNEYNNFVRDGYEGGVKSLPIRVIKDSYLNKLFPTKKLGKVDMQNKKADNQNLKKDSNYRIDKLQIGKPTMGNWVKYFTEGGYTTLLAKQKKYGTEITKAVSLKVTRESLTDPVILQEIIAKSTLNENITPEIVEGYLNTLESTLDTKSNEALGFDDLDFSRTAAEAKEWSKGNLKLNDLSAKVKQFVQDRFIDMGISPEKINFVKIIMKDASIGEFQRIGNIWRVVAGKKIVDEQVMKTMKAEAQKVIDLMPGELLEVIGLKWLGVHYRGINWTASEQKAIIKKAKQNKLSKRSQELFDKINLEHVSKHIQGEYAFKLALKFSAEKSLSKQQQMLIDERVNIKLANEANSALTNLMASLMDESKASEGYLFNMLQLQTNIVDGFRAYSTLEAMYLEEGALVPPLTKEGNLIKEPTLPKQPKELTEKSIKAFEKAKEIYPKKLKEYFAKWEATKHWKQELAKAKKRFPKLSLIEQKKKTVLQLMPKNEHLFPNALSMGKLFLSLFKKGFDLKTISKIFSEHKTLYAPKWVCDLIDVGGSTNQSGSRRVFFLPENVRKNIFATENGQVFQEKVIDENTNDLDLSKTEQSNSDQFNEILEQTKGVGAEKRFSNAAAKSRGAKKGLYDWFIPPSAEDFSGLLYKFLGKGKIGDKQMKFFKDKLMNPFASAMAEIDRRKQQMSNEYLALQKKMSGVKKMLGENTGYNEFTYDSAVRVYLWNKAGFEIPGLSKRDQTELVKKIKENPKLKLYADSLSAISKLKDGWVKPGESWLGGNIPTDISDINQKVNRKELLAEWVNNKNEIFSRENLNKNEAIYGTDFRESLEEILGRMERGSNRPIGSNQNKLTTKFMNWVNNSVGAIMFFNARSAILQTISAANFINFKDNNIFAAAGAFANQKQFWSDFTMLFNSDFLKQRRSGLKTDINEAEISNAVGTAPNKATAAFKYMLKKGFLPTQIADSFAIAMGGASFIRNRINSLVKSGMTKQEAMDQAMLDFREISEEAQQSSRPDRISSQQAGPLGRVILAFANTPMQYARMQKKAILDLKNGRGDWKTNMSKILYYGVVQNFIFNALQQALFAMAFDDDEERLDEKQLGIMNGMADSLLRGTGVAGAGVATVKNMVMELIRQNQKDRPDYVNVALKSTSISPPISSKLSKLISAARTFQWNGKEIREEGLSLDNPANLAVGKTVSAFTNIPLDRLIQKVDNLKTATEEETAAWQSIALTLGWDQWSLGLNPYQKKNKSSKKLTYKDLLKKRKKSSKKSKYKLRK